MVYQIKSPPYRPPTSVTKVAVIMIPAKAPVLVLKMLS
ncbi:hypothetical protein AO379_0253 [Moraxella catarrhalis]|nr:hypothetical protein AO379_0253 [Moraxella catarrhalis]OAV13481.1 hypothetical protein AO376_1660 [Moraxella catarrhalis]